MIDLTAYIKLKRLYQKATDMYQEYRTATPERKKEILARYDELLAELDQMDVELFGGTPHVHQCIIAPDDPDDRRCDALGYCECTCGARKYMHEDTWRMP